MRIKFKFLFALPLLLSVTSCSSSDKISFQCSDYTFETYYNDKYFMGDNSVVSEEVALASHAMALATFNGNPDYTKRSFYLRDLWKKEGFETIWFNDSFYEKPGTDTIGFGIASKTVQILGGTYSLIAIAVRGGNYDGEWTSNLTIGDSGDAKGFSEARDQVITGLVNFINNYKIEGNIKIWISGYSRAAITSNMVAGKILTDMKDGTYLTDKVSYRKQDIYAYCFEPPMGAYVPIEEARSDLYQGIHNFLNYNDFVPLVAPNEWGFVRFGTDHYYPDRLTDINFDETEREKMISLYHFTYGADKFPKYTVDDWKFFNAGDELSKEHNLPIESVNPSQGRFSRALIHEVAMEGIGSRYVYYFAIEAGLRELMKTVMGYNDEIGEIDFSNLINVIFQYDFIVNLLNELKEGRSADFAEDIQPLFLQIFGANEKNIDVLTDLYLKNIILFSSLANSFIDRPDVANQLLFRDNAMGIAIGHMPELSYAFLSACDSRIMGKKACKLNDGSYDTLHIESPVNFIIYEKTIKKEVFNYKDGVMNSSHLSAEKYADGSINIYLPKNGEYEYIGDIKESNRYNVDPLLGSAQG